MENDSKVYLVEGFAFFTKEEADKAAEEVKKVKMLTEKLDEDNLAAVRALYIKALDQDVFETEIGMTYLRNLQMHLIGEGFMKPEEKPLPVRYSKTQWLRETERMHEEANALEEKYKNKAKERVGAAKDKVNDAISKLRYLYLTIAILIVLIIGMFLITMTGKSANILNYRNAVIREYSDWEKDLKEREEKVRQKEAELNISGEEGYE